MIGADAVCQALAALGVDCVFGIPSQQNLTLYDAIRRHGDIRAIGVRHEQAAVHAADGYARATGRLGVAIASTGPGTANAVAGLFEAGFASSPVLLITTQIPSYYLGRSKGFIHDADRQLELMRSGALYADSVRHPDTIASQIADIANRILQGRRQPGGIEIPTDFLDAPVQNQSPDIRLERTVFMPMPAAIAEAVQRIEAAERPIIWVGGGAQDAAADVVRLVERLNAPAFSSLNGRGVLPAEHPLYVGWQTKFPDTQALLDASDLVIAIGTRFQAVATREWTLKMPEMVHIDIDPQVIGCNYPVKYGVVGDAGVIVNQLLNRVSPRPLWRNANELIAECRAKLRAATKKLAGPDHTIMCALLEKHRPKDSILMCDATRAGSTWGNLMVPIHGPRNAMYSTSLAIGPGLPVAMGAAIGTGRRTISINGDGGIMLSIPELATAVETKAPLLIMVFNDQCYGVLKGLQLQKVNAPFGVDLHTPDFQLLARSMAMPSKRAATLGEYEEALIEGLNTDGPFLLEVDVTKFAPIALG